MMAFIHQVWARHGPALPAGRRAAGRGSGRARAGDARLHCRARCRPRLHRHVRVACSPARSTPTRHVVRPFACPAHHPEKGATGRARPCLLDPVLPSRPIDPARQRVRASHRVCTNSGPIRDHVLLPQQAAAAGLRLRTRTQDHGPRCHLRRARQRARGEHTRSPRCTRRSSSSAPSHQYVITRPRSSTAGAQAGANPLPAATRRATSAC